ncbi:MAG: nitrate reductase molybdenum cofactor assembly chaperone [Alphaproteobacteria bacterium]|nr:nitrate reductase molybdenum cofactor assembly chaperone [Alphaproteobacteria bacterium]
MKTYRILARLLDYPTAPLVAALPELRALLVAEDVLPPAPRAAVIGLMERLATADLIDSQAIHVQHFDRVRTLSLHLFEHVHGDARSRGQAMVDLVELYRRHGLDVTAKELPDYLPLVLEFFSVMAPGAAREHLAETTPILARLKARLEARGSDYASLFDALIAIAAIKVAPVAIDGDPDEESPEAIDRAWEDAAVTFGAAPPAKDECGGAPRFVAR